MTRTDPTTPSRPGTSYPAAPRTSLDPGQREHELTEALYTLLLALSRFCGGDADRAAPTERRLALLEQLSSLLAASVAERVRRLRRRP